MPVADPRVVSLLLLLLWFCQCESNWSLAVDYFLKQGLCNASQHWDYKCGLQYLATLDQALK